MNARFQSLLDRFSDHPHLDALRKLTAAADRFAAETAGVKSNADLSATGQKKAITGHLRAALRDVRDAAAPLDEMRRDLDAKRSALALPKFDKSDLSGALLRQELRSILRGMSRPEQAGLLIGDKADAAFVDAALEQPALVSGLDSALFEQVRSARLATLRGAEIDAIELLDGDVVAFESTIETVKNDIRAVSGLGAREFDALARKVEEKRSAPWLLRQIHNGEETIVVVKPGEAHYPVATPDEIRDGKFYKDVTEYRADRAA